MFHYLDSILVMKLNFTVLGISLNIRMEFSSYENFT